MPNINRDTIIDEKVVRGPDTPLPIYDPTTGHLSGHYSLNLGTRGLESLRQEGRELDLCLPDACAKTAHDGREVAYLRAESQYAALGL